ncbi:DNA replication factor Cdt1 [Denticeps clupeoides]|uniref:CDT1 Geminin-binding domain-containing protein n=1 Tax=Denticeps clupeoides TaxID=299321 RepID=A0AAY4DP67_9TELE|nr:DNA replication factor Cdt1 [Denticeps clupeoides]
MAQARVTDYFTQSKKAGPERFLQKAVAAARNVPHADKRFTRSTTRARRVEPAERSCVQEEFLKLVDEAVSAPVRDAFELKPDELHSSPRTPKRTSAETKLHVASPVFSSVAAEHSTAKKRPRVSHPRDKGGRSQAARKLALYREGEQERVPGSVSVTPPECPVVQSVDKQSKNLVNHTDNTAVTQVKGPSSPLLPATTKRPLLKGDIVGLKYRLQKLKGKAESVLTPSPTPVSTLADLKAGLDRARELTAQVQERKEKAVEEDRSVPEETIGISEGEKLPAFQRFHTLAHDVPPGLTLPFKYKVLAEMFRSMETIVGMLFNRTETVTFAKVKRGVQDMMHKQFDESHIGQIKTVYPSAYVFRQEKNIPTFSATMKRSSYQLTIEPVIEEEKNSAQPVLSASRLLERRKIFHHNLVDVVKIHHKRFLASLDPPVCVPDDLLKRWHPRFRVDEVPNVVSSELPQPPQTEKLSTAQEVLDNARSLMTPKMEKALANMALKTAEIACSKEVVSVPRATVTPAETPSALKGVSQSLLERIRAKEAQKLQIAMTRNPKEEDRLLMMSRLAELARILRNVFIAEKKPSLIMELACNRMVSSYRSPLSHGEMEKHLRLLAELLPNWLTVHPIRKNCYLKLNKTLDMGVVMERLGQKIKEQERRE